MKWHKKNKRITKWHENNTRETKKKYNLSKLQIGKQQKKTKNTKHHRHTFHTRKAKDWNKFAHYRERLVTDNSIRSGARDKYNGYNRTKTLEIYGRKTMQNFAQKDKKNDIKSRRDRKWAYCNKSR